MVGRFIFLLGWYFFQVIMFSRWEGNGCSLKRLCFFEKTYWFSRKANRFFLDEFVVHRIHGNFPEQWTTKSHSLGFIGDERLPSYVGSSSYTMKYGPLSEPTRISMERFCNGFFLTVAHPGFSCLHPWHPSKNGEVMTNSTALVSEKPGRLFDIGITIW